METGATQRKGRKQQRAAKLQWTFDFELVFFGICLAVVNQSSCELTNKLRLFRFIFCQFMASIKYSSCCQTFFFSFSLYFVVSRLIRSFEVIQFEHLASNYIRAKTYKKYSVFIVIVQCAEHFIFIWREIKIVTQRKSTSLSARANRNEFAKTSIMVLLVESEFIERRILLFDFVN